MRTCETEGDRAGRGAGRRRWGRRRGGAAVVVLRAADERAPRRAHLVTKTALQASGCDGTRALEDALVVPRSRRFVVTDSCSTKRLLFEFPFVASLRFYMVMAPKRRFRTDPLESGARCVLYAGRLARSRSRRDQNRLRVVHALLAVRRVAARKDAALHKLARRTGSLVTGRRRRRSALLRNLQGAGVARPPNDELHLPYETRHSDQLWLQMAAPKAAFRTHPHRGAAAAASLCDIAAVLVLNLMHNLRARAGAAIKNRGPQVQCVRRPAP